MKTLQFSIPLDTSREAVWKALWDDANYRYWTQAFSEGSYAETDGWKEGTTVKFLTPSGEGMFSRIDKHVSGEIMTFRHLGMMRDGKMVTEGPDAEEWVEGKESYILKEKDGRLVLTASMETYEEYEEYFEETFPVALARVRERAENQKLF